MIFNNQSNTIRAQIIVWDFVSKWTKQTTNKTNEQKKDD